MPFVKPIPRTLSNHSSNDHANEPKNDKMLLCTIITGIVIVTPIAALMAFAETYTDSHPLAERMRSVCWRRYDEACDS